jgi:AcrR family transcriptional regulator
VISQSKPVDKQELIFQAALKLFVEYGFHGTPTSKIAQEAGVSNGTLFHYFKTKDELIIALYTRIKKQMSCDIEANVELEKSFETIFKQLMLRSLYWAMDHQTEFYFVQQFHMSPFKSLISSDEINEQIKRYSLLLKAAIDAKIIKPMPVELLYSLINMHIFGIYQYLTFNHIPENDYRIIIHEAYELLWDMISLKK